MKAPQIIQCFIIAHTKPQAMVVYDEEQSTTSMPAKRSTQLVQRFGFDFLFEHVEGYPENRPGGENISWYATGIATHSDSPFGKPYRSRPGRPSPA
jgi:hypothetical protein